MTSLSSNKVLVYYNIIMITFILLRVVVKTLEWKSSFIQLMPHIPMANI